MPSPASTPSAHRRRRQRHHQRPEHLDTNNYHRVITLPADTTSSLSPVAAATATAVAPNTITTASSTASVVAAAMAIANETNNDLIMINKIKQHQVLYDTDEDQYKYIDKRDKAWKEVADELGMPGKLHPHHILPIRRLLVIIYYILLRIYHMSYTLNFGRRNTCISHTLCADFRRF